MKIFSSLALFTPRRLLLGTGMAFLVFLCITVLGNPLIFWEFFKNTPDYSFFLCLKLFFLLVFGSFAGPKAFVLSIVLSVLFSINLILLLVDKRWRYFKNQKLGVAGILAGALGIGCATCGTLLTGTLVSLFGLSFVTATLPFQGLLFQVTSILFLLLSIGLLLREIDRNPACLIPKTNVS